MTKPLSSQPTMPESTASTQPEKKKKGISFDAAIPDKPAKGSLNKKSVVTKKPVVPSFILSCKVVEKPKPVAEVSPKKDVALPSTKVEEKPSDPPIQQEKRRGSILKITPPVTESEEPLQEVPINQERRRSSILKITPPVDFSEETVPEVPVAMPAKKKKKGISFAESVEDTPAKDIMNKKSVMAKKPQLSPFILSIKVVDKNQ
jgi:hypothetical protein